jgi:uncharacterized MAPEG superfamily protein
MLQVRQERTDIPAVIFVAARVTYIGCYAADRATLRSVVWFFGMACVFAVFISAV